jgi:acyl-CoA synthetase (AMP-forming)/AMP-acid ligase II
MLASSAGKKDVALLMADSDRVLRYGELIEWIEADRQLLHALPRPAVAFQFAPNSAGAVAVYLACLAEGLPLGLGEPALMPRTRVIDAYLPSALILPEQESGPVDYEPIGMLSGGELRLWRRCSGAYHVTPHRDLALLLATSGSTGDAKFVRLSFANLQANAQSIATYLGLGLGETAIQSLPLHYSYGLSVLNSHLLTGAAVALTSHSFMRPEFWRVFDECRCTSFAGVPYMYETLYRLRVNPADRASVRTLTQAGGHLRVDLVRHFNDLIRQKGGRFFVMYGQTEATARIAYVPPERLAEKIGMIGVAIPGGELWIEPVDGDETVRQLHYRGANVMLGYATGPKDLARGDELRGVLVTGDLAERDGDGFFRITGRLARFAKLFGKRINLAGVEAEVEKVFSTRTAVLDGGDSLRVLLEGANEPFVAKVRAYLAEWLGVPPLVVNVALIAQIPLTASGKKDYKALA